MNAPIDTRQDDAAPGMGLREFVLMMSALMSVNALGIDMMLPALGQIGRDLNVNVENHQQLVIVIYVGCFGVGQLFWGPLADRFGRRTILLGAMLVYALTSFIAAWSASFELLLVSRGLQGLSSAATRVLVIAIIRDRYAGRQMAKMIATSFTIFLAVPVIAPTLGQLIMLVAPWQWIFYFLGGYGLVVALWAWARLPETLDPANLRRINPATVFDAARQAITERYAIGYTLATASLYGGLLGFVSSSQQIIEHAFHAPEMFALCFATVGVAMAAASLLNARFVERLGMRLLAHGALLALILLCLVRLIVLLAGWETLTVFLILNGLTFFLYGLTGSNFSALAMERMSHIAGSASSVLGFIQTMIGTIGGLIIGQAFAGTTLPITLGWEINALMALAIVLIVERGRLFRPGSQH